MIHMKCTWWFMAYHHHADLSWNQNKHQRRHVFNTSWLQKSVHSVGILSCDLLNGTPCQFECHWLHEVSLLAAIGVGSKLNCIVPVSKCEVTKGISRNSRMTRGTIVLRNYKLFGGFMCGVGPHCHSGSSLIRRVKALGSEQLYCICICIKFNKSQVNKTWEKNVRVRGCLVIFSRDGIK